VAGRLQTAVVWMMLAIITSGICFVVLGKYLGRLPFLNRLTLDHTHTATMRHGEAAASSSTTVVSGGEIASPRRARVMGDEVSGQGHIKAGDVGRALGTLRPTGRAQFGDRIVDVITDGQWIEPGRAVCVTALRAGRIVVQVHTPRG
jgi:membrane-bound serine protease (ClpP class)